MDGTGEAILGPGGEGARRTAALTSVRAGLLRMRPIASDTANLLNRPVRKGLIALAFGIQTIILGCTPSDDQGAVSIGAPAPPYQAVTVTGDSVSVAALRGRVVLLNIWATWCHPCREEIPVLQELHERHGRDGLEIVGVSVDARGETPRIADFATRFRMTYPLWHDPDDRVSTVYRAVGVPATYLIDRDGILRWRRLGPIAENDPSLARALAAALAPAGAGGQ